MKKVLTFLSKSSSCSLSAMQGTGDVRPFPTSKSTSKSNHGKPALTKAEEEARKNLIARCKIIQRQLGIGDKQYRQILQTNFGVSSCTELDDACLLQLLEAYRVTMVEEELYKMAKDKPQCMADSNNPLTPSLRRIEALLAEIGKVRGKYIPWSYAAGILRKNTGLDDLEAATVRELRGVMVALERTLKCDLKKQA